MRVFVNDKCKRNIQGTIGVYCFSMVLLMASSCGHRSTPASGLLNLSEITLADAARMGSIQRGKLPKTLSRDCGLWSDWRQLCSHLGDGQWFCVESAAQAVEPSAPFCLNSVYGIDPNDMLRKESFESAGRYCSQSVMVAKSPYFDEDSGEYVFATKKYCSVYESNRPFNGKRVAERRHPWCLEWTDSGSKEIVCSETDKSTKSCQDLASARFESPNRLVCSTWDLPTRWCEEAGDYYDSLEGPNESVQLENMKENMKDGKLIVSFGPQLSPPVYGVACGDFIRDRGEINE